MFREFIAVVSNHPFISFALGVGLITVLSYLVDLVKSSIRTTAFERSRQEAMAYVAEGSMTAEQAAAMLAIEQKLRKPESDEESEESESKKDAGARLASALSWGQVEKDDADALIAARTEVDETTWSQMVDYAIEGMDAEAAINLAKARSRPGGMPAAVPA
jgi:hypothetical protein